MINISHNFSHILSVHLFLFSNTRAWKSSRFFMINSKHTISVKVIREVSHKSGQCLYFIRGNEKTKYYSKFLW